LEGAYRREEEKESKELKKEEEGKGSKLS